MLLASVLFVLAGIFDGVYPGGRLPFTDLAAISWVFAIINTVVAYLVARGSERSLALRMGLSLFFVVERPASAFLIGTHPTSSIVVHLATAAVELVILVSALGVWRLGHSVATVDMDQLYSLDNPTPPPAVTERPDPPASNSSALPANASWLIGGTTLLLAAVLVADGVASNFLPGGRDWGVSGESSGWLVYLFAAVVLTVAAIAVKGGRLALRLLAITAMIFFIERAFSPFALRVVDPVVLGLHGLAAFVALAVALSAASAIRGSRSRSDSDATLEAA
jgi:hypothetical protein